MSIPLVLCAMCFNIVIGAAANSNIEEERVVGGVDTKEGEIPFQIMLKLRGSGICGGSLVQLGSAQAVITAAHCLHSSDTAVYSVVAGEHKISVISGHEQTRAISKISIHPEYNPRRNTNDIAVIIPQEPFELNEFVLPIRLPKKNDGVPSNGQISGWGTTEPWRLPTDILQKANAKIVDNTICKENYEGTDHQIEDTMVCAGEEGIDTCQGDSGGPLAAHLLETNDFYLLGVVSFGLGCARPFYPGVLSRVCLPLFHGLLRKLEWMWIYDHTRHLLDSAQHIKGFLVFCNFPLSPIYFF